MRPLYNLSIIVLIILFSSCGSTTKFPVSSIVPAAEISVKKKQDKQNNYVIELVAENLAQASRVDPGKNNYSVWIRTENGEIKNLGQLRNKNAEKAVLNTSTPFEPKEIFITAEEQANLNAPQGIEIARYKFD